MPVPCLRSCGRRTGGFTLLEVLLALVLLAIAAAIIVPAVVRPAGTELRAAAGSVAAALRGAREQAVNAQQTATLLVDTERREFSVSGNAHTRRIPERVKVSLYTARSELESDVRGRIRFFPDGSSTGGRVTLASGHRGYFVDVDWLTGRVKLRSGKPEAGAESEVGQVLPR